MGELVFQGGRLSLESRPIISPRLVHSEAGARTSGNEDRRKKCTEIKRSFAEAQLNNRAHEEDRMDPAYTWEVDTTAQVLKKDIDSMCVVSELVGPSIMEIEGHAVAVEEFEQLEQSRLRIKNFQEELYNLKSLAETQESIATEHVLMTNEELLQKFQLIDCELKKEKENISLIMKRGEERRQVIENEALERSRKQLALQELNLTEPQKCKLGDEQKMIIECRAQRYGNRLREKKDREDAKLLRVQQKHEKEIEELSSLIQYIDREMGTTTSPKRKLKPIHNASLQINLPHNMKIGYNPIKNITPVRSRKR